jgi:hypothetical protein
MPPQPKTIAEIMQMEQNIGKGFNQPGAARQESVF